MQPPISTPIPEVAEAVVDAEEIVEQLQVAPEVETIILQILLFLIVIILIWALRRAITWVIMRPLRALVHRTNPTIDDEILESLVIPIRLLIIAAGFYFTVRILDFGASVTTFADLVARSAVIAAVIVAIVRVIDIIAINPNTLLRITGITINPRLLPFLRTVLKIFIYAMGIVIIVQEWGYDANGLIASLGVVGLALSLAAQDTASNVFGFAAIVGDNPFEVGDFIVTPDVQGTVEHVGVRSTRIRRIDQAIASVPNSVLTNATLVNWTRLRKRRFDTIIGLTYDTTSSQMEAFLEELRIRIAEHNIVERDSTIVHFIEFGDSSLNIRVIASILLAEWADYTAEVEQLNLIIMRLVDEMGLSMAFPSRSIYIESMPTPNNTPIG